MKRTNPKAGRLPLGDPKALAALQAIADATSRKIAADPRGFGDDHRACGVLQVHHPEKYVDGATCAKVRADRRRGLPAAVERGRRREHVSPVGLSGWLHAAVRTRTRRVDMKPSTFALILVGAFVYLAATIITETATNDPDSQGCQ